jgi:predicted peptidase
MAIATSAISIAAEAATPDSAGRFESSSVRVGRVTHRFTLWRPPGYETRSEWPAIVVLHGVGECGSDGRRPTLIGLGPELIENPRRWPFVVVFPQKPLEEEEWEEREALVLAALDQALRTHKIDRRRVALAGFSQGGHGVWMIGARHPDRWSCLVPICGYGRARTIAPRIATLPVWAFHGLKDDVIDPRDTRLIMAALRTEQERRGLDHIDARMTLFDEANHNSWDPAFDEPELPAWILAQTSSR